jgi:peptide/nickel transport system substrate-binding protein
MKRKMMHLIGLLVLSSLVLTACAPAAAPSAAPAEAPAAAEEAVAVGLGDLPRNETLIADILTGRVGSPSNFNNWVGWKWRDRGMQNLANEPLWTVDFATGEIINGLADGDPVYNEDFTALTIPLRQGVTWSDGEPFTAADVVFTVETIMKFEGFNDNSYFVENVKSVTASDDNTVAFELNKANSRWRHKYERHPHRDHPTGA